MKNLGTTGLIDTQLAELTPNKNMKTNHAAWQHGLGSLLKGWFVFWLIVAMALVAFKVDSVQKTDKESTTARYAVDIP